MLDPPVNTLLSSLVCGLYRDNPFIPLLLASFGVAEIAVTVGSAFKTFAVVEFGNLCVATTTPFTVILPASVFLSYYTMSIISLGP